MVCYRVIEAKLPNLAYIFRRRTFSFFHVAVGLAQNSVHDLLVACGHLTVICSTVDFCFPFIPARTCSFSFDKPDKWKAPLALTKKDIQGDYERTDLGLLVKRVTA